MRFRRIIFSIITGCIVTVLSLLIHITGLWSGVEWRGLPVAIIKKPPFWATNRDWRITHIGAIIDITIWSLLAYPFFALMLRGNEKSRDDMMNVCKKCGYNLRGLRDPRCPECGTPFDPNLLNGKRLP